MEMFYTYVSWQARHIVNETLLSGRLSEGMLVKDFERGLARQLGLRNPVCTNSGTSALHLALVLAGVGPGDEVILPAQTFIATGLAVLYCGATPVFADVDPETGLLDYEDAAQRWTPRCKAFLPVDWCGLPCDRKAFVKLRPTPVVVDACQSLGATYRGEPVSDWCDYACLSFQATKHLTTGDGGAVCCGSADDVPHARRLRWFGLDREQPLVMGEREFLAEEAGYKYHLNDYAAALGLGNLPGFKERLARRQAIGARYRAELQGVLGLKLPRMDPDRTHAYYAFSVLVERRQDFHRALGERKVPCSVICRRIDRHRVFDKGQQRFLPGTDYYDTHQINLPCHEALTDEDVGKVIEAVKAGW